jgi:PIN domain nuclease of toxin-antitoxin system
MRLLLDTHAFLWFIAGDPQLSPTARERIEEPANLPFLSMASLWEIGIKTSLGRLVAPPMDRLLAEHLEGRHLPVADRSRARPPSVHAPLPSP